MPGIGTSNQISTIFDHITSESMVYPSLAAGATVVSANADWTYGAYATVVAAGVITVRYHIVNVSIESCNRNAVFQLQLYKGAADDVVATVRFAVSGGFFGNQLYQTNSEPIEASSQLRARLASSNGLAEIATITISVGYHDG